MPLNVTSEHFERIHSFLQARIEPLLDAATGSEHGFADDDTSRALRALSHQVVVAAAAGSLCAGYEEEDAHGKRYTELRTGFAWGALSDIARHWNDHPDYLPEFALNSFDLPNPGSQQ